MRLQTVLLRAPTDPVKMRGGLARFTTAPRVAHDSPLRLRDHNPGAVGYLFESWTDSLTGDLLACWDVVKGQEQRVRDALRRSMAGSIEVRGLNPTTERGVVAYSPDAVIVGLAVAVPNPGRPDTRVLAVENRGGVPHPFPVAGIPAARSAPAQAWGPFETVSFGQRVTAAGGEYASFAPRGMEYASFGRTLQLH